ncbi:hypothetical protein L596_000496 [Steinernema carpocapsae]|uniref:Uncharacterized protein n=1 Tax=Steinernema carpocapsae TaxID=34508 RepID=A0A4U8UMJ0_STECR|nr:hypothetical protein L596_000496 [Steinernema carpocapsae]
MVDLRVIKENRICCNSTMNFRAVYRRIEAISTCFHDSSDASSREDNNLGMAGVVICLSIFVISCARFEALKRDVSGQVEGRCGTVSCADFEAFS